MSMISLARRESSASDEIGESRRESVRQHSRIAARRFGADVADPECFGKARVDEREPERGARSRARRIDSLEAQFDRQQYCPRIYMERDHRAQLRREGLRQTRPRGKCSHAQRLFGQRVRVTRIRWI